MDDNIASGLTHYLEYVFTTAVLDSARIAASSLACGRETNRPTINGDNRSRPTRKSSTSRHGRNQRPAQLQLKVQTEWEWFTEGGSPFWSNWMPEKEIPHNSSASCHLANESLVEYKDNSASSKHYWTSVTFLCRNWSLQARTVALVGDCVYTEWFPHQVRL